MHKITHLQAASLYETLYGKTAKINLSVLKDIFSAAWSSKDGEYLYFGSVYKRAAKLLLAIADQKPFPAHNGAMAVSCALTLLELNGKSIPPSEKNIKEMLSFPHTEEGVTALGERFEAEAK